MLVTVALVPTVRNIPTGRDDHRRAGSGPDPDLVGALVYSETILALDADCVLCTPCTACLMMCARCGKAAKTLSRPHFCFTRSAAAAGRERLPGACPRAPESRSTTWPLANRSGVWVAADALGADIDEVSRRWRPFAALPGSGVSRRTSPCSRRSTRRPCNSAG